MSFIVLFVFGRLPKSQCAYELHSIGSPGLIWCATCTIFRTGSAPGASGAHRGPRNRIYRFIFPKVCPAVRAAMRSSLLSPTWAHRRAKSTPRCRALLYVAAQCFRCTKAYGPPGTGSEATRNHRLPQENDRPEHPSGSPEGVVRAPGQKKPPDD